MDVDARFGSGIELHVFHLIMVKGYAAPQTKGLVLWVDGDRRKRMVP